MSVSVTYTSNVTTNETLETNVPAADPNKAVITHDQFNTQESLNATSAVPVTKSVYFVVSLSGGAATIDLTSLTGVNNESVDGTGLKLQVLKMKNRTGNATMTIDVGASNGYELAGAGFEATLQAGQELTFFGNDATPDIGASAKTLDLTGTGTESAEISIVMG